MSQFQEIASRLRDEWEQPPISDAVKRYQKMSDFLDDRIQTRQGNLDCAQNRRAYYVPPLYVYNRIVEARCDRALERTRKKVSFTRENDSDACFLKDTALGFVNELFEVKASEDFTLADNLTTLDAKQESLKILYRALVTLNRAARAVNPLIAQHSFYQSLPKMRANLDAVKGNITRKDTVAHDPLWDQCSLLLSGQYNLPTIISNSYKFAQILREMNSGIEMDRDRLRYAVVQEAKMPESFHDAYRMSYG